MKGWHNTQLCLIDMETQVLDPIQSYEDDPQSENIDDTTPKAGATKPDRDNGLHCECQIDVRTSTDEGPSDTQPVLRLRILTNATARVAVVTGTIAGACLCYLISTWLTLH